MTSLNEDKAYQLSHKWFLVNGEDRQVAGNVSIGLVVQLMVFEYFFKKANETRTRSGVRGFIKNKHLEWHVRFIHNYLTHWTNEMHHVDVVTVYDVNNKPMIENANLVANMCNCQQQSVAGIVVDRSIYQQTLAAQIDCFYLTNMYGVFDELAAKRMARQQIRIFNHHYSAYCKNLSVFNISEKETRTFLKFIRKQIHQICREIIALINLLVKLTPKAILLTSDAHRIGRIIVQIARSLGIKTYVLQHGAPIWKYGYVPVVADKMLVWGEDAFSWFSNNGVPATKLSIVGNPRFDNFTLDEPKKNKGQAKKLILLPNPIDRALICRMISTFIKSVSSHDGPIIIKLHPSETDINWFHNQIPKHLKQQIQISTKPLGEMNICLGDVAVVANSTAGVDVVLLGGAIVNVELQGMPNPIPYSKYMVGVNADLENLSDAITMAKSFNQVKWAENRKIFLKKFLFNLDGMSTKRAAKIIIEGIL